MAKFPEQWSSKARNSWSMLEKLGSVQHRSVQICVANPSEVQMDPNVEKLEWLVEVMEDGGGFSDVFLSDHLKE